MTKFYIILTIIILAVAAFLLVSKMGDSPDDISSLEIREEMMGNEQETEGQSDSETNETNEGNQDVTMTQETHIVAQQDSQVIWRASKTGTEHFGEIKSFDGSATIVDDSLVGGTLVLDMNSIEVQDISGNFAQGLFNDLVSGNFFDANKYPTTTFTLISAEGALSDGNIVVTGDMTIRGISNEITVPLSVRTEGETTYLSGIAELDRSRWGITFQPANAIINDIFTVEISLALQPRA